MNKVPAIAPSPATTAVSQSGGNQIDESAFLVNLHGGSGVRRPGLETLSQYHMKLKMVVFTALAFVSQGAIGATVATWSASGGANPGTDGWTQDLTGTGGWFQGNSGGNAGGSSGAGAGNPAWALWSDSSGVSAATWSLVGGALTVGQTLGINFDNGWVDSGGVGVQFTSGGNVALAVFLNNGGPGYEITNSSGNVNSGQAWTGDGFNISVELTGSGAYELSFLGYNDTGTFANAATAIDGIRVFSFDPTGSGSGGNYDVFFNNISVVPEPSAALLGGLGVLALLRRRRA